MTGRLTRRFFVTRSLAAATATTLAPGVLPRWPGGETPVEAATLPEVAVRAEAVDDPTELTVAEAAALIRRGELTSEELVRACLRRIDEFDDIYLAFNTVLRSRRSATPGGATESVLAARCTAFRWR